MQDLLKALNQLLALKIMGMVSIVAIMTWSGWMINVTGAMKLPDE
jgi:hypothetical protein